MYLQTLSLGWSRPHIISLNPRHLMLKCRLLAIMTYNKILKLGLIITRIRNIRLLAMLTININILMFILIFFHFMN